MAWFEAYEQAIRDNGGDLKEVLFPILSGEISPTGGTYTLTDSQGNEQTFDYLGNPIESECA